MRKINIVHYVEFYFRCDNIARLVQNVPSQWTWTHARCNENTSGSIELWRRMYRPNKDV